MYQIVIAAIGSHLKTVHFHLVGCKNDVEIIRNITGIHQTYVSSTSKKLNKNDTRQAVEGEWRMMGRLMSEQ